MNFEYVLSGMNYTCGINYVHIEEVKQMYQDFFNSKPNDITVSCLFNAFTEKNLGKILSTKIELPRIYGDSGGLQMALYGHDITAEARSKIYEVQSKYADIAFCFDDIPVQMIGPVDSVIARTLTDNKYFDRSLLKEKAIKTANNIKEQIAHFEANDSKTKIFAIIQGNCADTFTDWGNYLFDELTEDEIDRIHGLALADTCAGTGMFQTIEMIRCINRIDAPEKVKKNIHFLGIATIPRFMPIIELSHTPVLKGKHISTDATTHSSAIVMGKYFDSGLRSLNTGKAINEFTNRMVDEVIHNWFPHHKETELKQIVLKNLGTIKHLKEEHDLQIPLIQYAMAYNFEMVHRFTYGIKESYDNFDAYYKYVRDKRVIAFFRKVRSIQSHSQFEAWVKEHAKYMPSKQIARRKPSTLEELFA